MKILVTGGLGYIGSHTIAALINHGCSPIILDNQSNSSIDVLDRLKKLTGEDIPYYNVDITNRLALDNVFKDSSIDGIIHFAALKSVDESLEKPILYYENNINGFINLLAVALDNGVHHLVFSSSCTVYGDSPVSPVTETMTIGKAITPYGHSKEIGENLLKLWTTSSGAVKAVALRYFNPIGAHESALIGELPNGAPKNLVPYITQTAVGKRDVLKIFGNDFPTKDGFGERDFIHVSDLADAHVKALEYLRDKNSPAFDVFNVGTGSATSVLELVETFTSVNKVELKYEVVGRRNGDIASIYANTDKVETVLGWKATYTLEEALRSAYQWELQLLESSP